MVGGWCREAASRVLPLSSLGSRSCAVSVWRQGRATSRPVLDFSVCGDWTPAICRLHRNSLSRQDVGSLGALGCLRSCRQLWNAPSRSRQIKGGSRGSSAGLSHLAPLPMHQHSASVTPVRPQWRVMPPSPQGSLRRHSLFGDHHHHLRSSTYSERHGSPLTGQS